MSNTVCDLTSKQCKPCEGGVPPLSATEVSTFLQQIDGWQLLDKQISKTYAFKNYYQTMAFVNGGMASHRKIIIRYAGRLQSMRCHLQRALRFIE
jgi:4a-hydroxytetrahydrobiopterin dehydratase